MIGRVYTAHEIGKQAQATQVHEVGEPLRIRHIAFDTRKIHHPEETIFIALKGKERNGHSFIPEAIRKGVKCFLVSEEKVVSKEAAFIVVDDVKEALQTWAANHRKSIQIPVIGITGSNGKTIVKEWLAILLSGSFKVSRSPKSYNSQIGVPISVLQIHPDSDVALIEAGVSKKGEMEILANVIQPGIGIMTHFGDAHEEGFDSKKEKLKEKFRLFEGVKKLVVSLDQEEVAEELENFEGDQFLVSAQENEAADLYVRSATQTSNGWELELVYEEETSKLRIPLSGKAALENGVLAIGAALAMGQTMQQIKENLDDLGQVTMRMEIISTNPEITLINDAYNADTDSVFNAISLLEEDRSHSRKILVLTDLESIGGKKEARHKAILKGIEKTHPELELILIGPVFSGLGSDHPSFQNTDEFLDHLRYKDFKESTVLLKGARKFELERVIPYLTLREHVTQFSINLDHLVQNFNALRALVPPVVKTMAMVKAFAYGSGSWEVASALEKAGADYLAVAVTSEGIALREGGVTLPILVLNPDDQYLEQLFRYNLEPEIYNFALLERYYKTGQVIEADHFPIHLKLDTGMHRLGFVPEELGEVLKRLMKMPEIQVSSIFSHLPSVPDPTKDEETIAQFDLFRNTTERFLKGLAQRPFFTEKPLRHILNTAGCIRFPEYAFDMVRLGIGLYGIDPANDPNLNLKEIGTLTSRISQIRTWPRNTAIGYDGIGMTTRESKVATIPVGYADGIPRTLSNGNYSFLVRGIPAPTIGTVCMDMLMLDVTDIPDVAIGDEVILFGEELSVANMAAASGTIHYEILAGISGRVKRVYLME